MNRLGAFVALVTVLAVAGCGGSSASSDSSSGDGPAIGTEALVDFHVCFNKTDRTNAMENEAAFVKASTDPAFAQKEQKRYERTQKPTPEERFDASVELCDSYNLLHEDHGNNRIGHEEAIQFVEEACEAFHEDKKAVLESLAKTFHGKAIFPRIREFTDLCYQPNG